MLHPYRRFRPVAVRGMAGWKKPSPSPTFVIHKLMFHVNALVIAAQVWPCYFTGWTAASEWSLTDQVFRTTVLKTTARVRASAVRLLDHDYLISSATDMTWGLKSQWRSEY